MRRCPSCGYPAALSLDSAPRIVSEVAMWTNRAHDEDKLACKVCGIWNERWKWDEGVHHSAFEWPAAEEVASQ